MSTPEFRLTAPVALIIFRRPELTRRILDAIARARPPVLYVIADGPRSDQEGEACAKTRALIDEINWPCEVVRHYADTNMGLKRRFATGLSWLFEQVDEAIILEDDCLPDDTFFRFCQTLLETYRDDARVMQISGTCPYSRPDHAYSYYFSHFAHVWGWATWKRAWQLYDGELDTWDSDAGRKAYLDHFDDRDEKLFWMNALTRVRTGVLNTWDYQWVYSCIVHDGLSIMPTANLVSNLGFGADATHTLDAGNPFANLPCYPVTFPLRHPDTVTRDVEADQRTAQTFFSFGPYWKSIMQQMARTRGDVAVNP